MRILITGASCFLGRPLAVKAAALGWETVLTVRPGRDVSGFPKQARIVRLDMEEYTKLGTLVGPCDCAVHLAWDGTRGSARMDAERQRKNVEYTLAGIRSVLDAGCGRIVLAGSQAEYGPHAEQITEQTPSRPNTEYGKAKLALYRKTVELCSEKNVPVKEPRFFSVYGPGDYGGTMIIHTLGEMLAGRPCKMTEGVQMWDFLYIDDAIEGIVRLCRDTCPDGIYNFGSGDVRQLRAYVEEMAALTRTESELQFGAVPYPETGMVSLWPDISRLKRELHWAPRVTFGDGIRTILTTIKTAKGDKG